MSKRIAASPSPNRSSGKRQGKQKGKAQKPVIEGNTGLLTGSKAILDKSKFENIPAIRAMDIHQTYTYGIPIRNYLPLCRLLGTDVLALSRALTIVGPEESFKSSLGWFLQRVILQAGGLVIYLDTEYKASLDMIMGIVDIPEVFDPDNPKVIHIECSSKEQAYEMLYLFTERYEEVCEAAGLKPGAPMGILYDSIKGGASRTQLEARRSNEDTPGYQHMHNASALQETLMTTMSESLRQKPILLTATNHEMRKKPDFPGQPVGTYEVGGAFKEFMWTWKLRMKGLRSTNNRTDQGSVELKMGKCSLHEKQTQGVPLLFNARYDGKNRAHFRFDWDTAITLLLSNAEIFPKERSKNILSVSKNGRTYNCRQLGMTEVTAAEIGYRLNNELELQNIVLRDIFNIPPGGILYDGKIYQAAREDLGDSRGTRKALELAGGIRDIPIVYTADQPPITVVGRNDWNDEVSDKTEHQLTSTGGEEEDQVEDD